MFCNNIPLYSETSKLTVIIERNKVEISIQLISMFCTMADTKSGPHFHLPFRPENFSQNKTFVCKNVTTSLLHNSTRHFRKNHDILLKNLPKSIQIYKVLHLSLIWDSVYTFLFAKLIFNTCFVHKTHILTSILTLKWNMAKCNLILIKSR